MPLDCLGIHQVRKQGPDATSEETLEKVPERCPSGDIIEEHKLCLLTIKIDKDIKCLGVN